MGTGRALRRPSLPTRGGRTSGLVHPLDVRHRIQPVRRVRDATLLKHPQDRVEILVDMPALVERHALTVAEYPAFPTWTALNPKANHASNTHTQPEPNMPIKQPK